MPAKGIMSGRLPMAEASGGYWTGKRGIYLAVLIVCLTVFSPGQTTIPAIDRDEPRFAEASRQMAKTGDWVDIRFQDETRYKKPAGIYWLQAASVRLLGEKPDNPIWPYRLPSLLAAISAVMMTMRLAKSMAGQADLQRRRLSFAAGLLLATSVLMNMEARLATSDAVLLLTVCLAFAGLWPIWQAGREGRPAPREAVLLFWLGLAAGVLVKGPVILGVAGCAILALCISERRASWLAASRPLPGIAIFLAAASPWLILIGLRSHGMFFRESLGHDFGSKIASGQESHGLPPGSYLLMFPLLFWPGSLLAILAVPYAWRHRAEPPVRFLLCWLLPGWLLFESVPTKLPHYVLPFFPPVAILSAWGLGDIEVEGGNHWFRKGAFAVFIAASLLVAAACEAPWVIDRTVPLPTALVCGLATCAGLLTAWMMLAAARDRRALPSTVLAAIVFYTLVFGAVTPRVEAPFLSRAIARQRLDYPPALRRGDVALAGYHEPSAVLMLGEDTLLASPEEAARALADGKVVLAYVGLPEQEPFLAAIQGRGTAVTLIDQVQGQNYSHGQRVQLAVYRLGS